jgi:hypothetical protein
MEEIRNTCKILVGKPEGKRTLGRPRRRLDSYGSGQGAVVGCCEHGNELLSSIKGEGFLD